jgi:hypothetical protein
LRFSSAGGLGELADDPSVSEPIIDYDRIALPMNYAGSATSQTKLI